jgi:hypothetical protein
MVLRLMAVVRAAAGASRLLTPSIILDLAASLPPHGARASCPPRGPATWFTLPATEGRLAPESSERGNRCDPCGGGGLSG